MHVRRLEQTITEGLLKRGFSFIEVISPCPTVYGRMNRQPTGLDQMRYYRENSIIRHGADPKDVDIDLNGKIIVGKFINIERPTYSDLLDEVVQKAFEPELPKHDTSKKEVTVAGSMPKQVYTV
jgi:2-oxoglutarate ferredoxin oxidoreductase subunit beta